jgi:hypothetical protein
VPLCSRPKRRKFSKENESINGLVLRLWVRVAHGKHAFRIARTMRPRVNASSQSFLVVVVVVKNKRGNDPSAGSPTETLLRLHLPLDGKV